MTLTLSPNPISNPHPNRNLQYVTVEFLYTNAMIKYKCNYKCNYKIQNIVHRFRVRVRVQIRVEARVRVRGLERGLGLRSGSVLGLGWACWTSFFVAPVALDWVWGNHLPNPAVRENTVRDRSTIFSIYPIQLRERIRLGIGQQYFQSTQSSCEREYG